MPTANPFSITKIQTGQVLAHIGPGIPETVVKESNGYKLCPKANIVNIKEADINKQVGSPKFTVVQN